MQRRPPQQAQGQRPPFRPAPPEVVDLPVDLPADDDLTSDLWEDNREEELIEVQKPLNLPKKKVMEYEEETDY